MRRRDATLPSRRAASRLILPPMRRFMICFDADAVYHRERRDYRDAAAAESRRVRHAFIIIAGLPRAAPCARCFKRGDDVRAEPQQMPPKAAFCHAATDDAEAYVSAQCFSF